MKTTTLTLSAVLVLGLVTTSFGLDKFAARYGKFVAPVNLAAPAPPPVLRHPPAPAPLVWPISPGKLPGVKLALPDLEITDVFLTPKCYVAVRVRNNGPGRVPDEVWTVHTPESCAVYLYVDGRGWGGATLWNFDPARGLQRPGGSAVYVSNLKVEKKALVTAVVDHTEQVREMSESNNKMAKELLCRGGGVRPVPPMPAPVPMLPDLEVVGIGLDRDHRVMVKIRNNGPARLPDEVWTVHTPQSCAVYLYLNDRGWGGGTIWAFDASGALQAPGGVAVYTSNLKVTGQATITAVVDHTRQVRETNEINNKLARKFDLP